MEKFRPCCFSWMIPGIFALCFLAAGCATEPLQLNRISDSPEHHASNGYKFLKKGRYSEAQREFQLALEVGNVDPRSVDCQQLDSSRVFELY